MDTVTKAIELQNSSKGKLLDRKLEEVLGRNHGKIPVTRLKNVNKPARTIFFKVSKFMLKLQERLEMMMARHIHLRYLRIRNSIFRVALLVPRGVSLRH